MWMTSQKLHPEVTVCRSNDFWSDWSMFLDKEIEQAAALPVTMPPGMRFFHDIIACLNKRYEVIENWKRDEVDALKLIVRREYMILMIVSWY